VDPNANFAAQQTNQSISNIAISKGGIEEAFWLVML
jgi:hypothetical protein